MQMHSLTLFKGIKDGDLSVLKDNQWLQYLYLTKEARVNLERVSTVKDIKTNSVFDYVEKTLKLLKYHHASEDVKKIVEEVLIWSEVAKCGLPHKRKEWTDKGFNLTVHNIGSSQIYAEYINEKKTDIQFMNSHYYIVSTLIATHGLIGQYLRGEVKLSENKPLADLVKSGFVNKGYLCTILETLNECILRAVSDSLWNDVKEEVCSVIKYIIGEDTSWYVKEFPVKERLKRLRKTAIANGEDFDTLFTKFFEEHNINGVFEFIFTKSYLWYVESALSEFNFEEFLKIFLLSYRYCNRLSLEHLSFENLMKDIYYDYQGKKTVNVYKKRIIEKYLSDISIKDILIGEVPVSEHVSVKVTKEGVLGSTIGITFEFSPAGTKMIEFCQEAEKSNIYGKGIQLLYDLFGFRKDQYDRFNNEKSYLDTMNKSIDHKAIMLDYVVGDKVIDIGPGGGAMMDLICERYPNAKVLGLDISTNAVEELNKKRIKEGKAWGVIQADVVNVNEKVDDIHNYFSSMEGVNTFTFSSIIHEIFSYNELDGRKFNYESIRRALKNAYDLLAPGGRIVIRDGIMTEPQDLERIIRFKNKNDMLWFNRYVNEFKGREIRYEKLSDDTVKLDVNDAMEFLYTFTWGADSFDLEIHEQFGYFTPTDYRNFIHDTLGDTAKIIECKHYLQEGYEENLLIKIDYMDETMKSVQLPDSTCLIVIEKEV